MILISNLIWYMLCFIGGIIFTFAAVIIILLIEFKKYDIEVDDIFDSKGKK